ncbi:MAG: DNA mismatch repair endonuclease MutL [Deltaproteobacteria bacterium]|nr:DNA mismatch repair endonuclease MutL [Deltaproteobacteria bacterium]
MGIINLLPENLINQIAAGEVVERPASVVKELIENSIDAEATEIIIDVEDGGRRLIRVSDNGCGMSREDALLSIQRHATSKIREVSDLFNISTLGFRGEALPSIASVSKLRLTTVPKGSTFGTSIRVEGGKELEVIDSGGPVGTSMEVRELFFNTPARLKFMKSTTTEMSHITSTVTRMAISYPYIRFIYNHNGSQIYNLPSSKDLLSRICKLIREDDKNLIEVSLNSKISVSGYVSGPEINRPTQRETYIFVNGRFVRDRVVLHAVMDAYRTVMEKDRYPLAFLFLDVPPMDVDVNVHPAKTEVRFRNTDEIHRAVYAAVSEALKGWTARKGSGQWSVGTGRSDEFQTPDSNYQDRVSEAIGKYATSNSSAFGPIPSPTLYPSGHKPLKGREFFPLHQGEGQGEGGVVGFFSSLTVLGRVSGTYIICSRGNDLCLIDQHAAHERVAFERLKAIRNDSTPASQTLLIPETVELNPSETGLLKDYTEVLTKAGIELEHFGGNTFVIKAVPTILTRKDVKGLIKDIVDELAHMERSQSLKEIMDRLFSRMACHSAIEGGDYMDPAEIKALLRDLDSIDFSSNCPHGRPVFVMLSQFEIEKMFGRR